MSGGIRGYPVFVSITRLGLGFVKIWIRFSPTNFLTFLHTVVRAGESNEKFLTFSNVWNFGKRSFSYINSTHAENSSLFPHIFLTLKFHSVAAKFPSCRISCDTDLRGGPVMEEMVKKFQLLRGGRRISRWSQETR